jgi:uncharacterized protein (DUF58 family)
VIVPSPLALKIAGALALASMTGAAVPAAGWACVAALALLAFAVLLDGRRVPPDAVAWRRRAPARLSLGEPEPILEELQSLCPFPLEVRIAESFPSDLELAPSAVSPIVRLPPRGRVEVRFTAIASRRGQRRVPRPTLRVGRPGGLAVRQGPVGSEEVLEVSPNVARLKRYETLRQSRHLATVGVHRTRDAGLGSEFDHLRAYSRDDDHRRIHWKATAKRGFPITQVVRVERGQSVLIAVDASHWMGISAGALSRLDYAVDAALFLAHVAQRSGDQVGLCIFAHEVLAFLAPSSKPGQIRRLLEALSAVQPRGVHPSYRNLVRHVLSRRLRRSLVVVVSEPVDPESAEELRQALSLLRARHLPLCVGLRDPALAAAAEAVPTDVLDLCRRLAAREAQEEREERFRLQRQRGFQVLDVLPAELSVALVNRYLEVKGRGAL